MGLLWAGLFCTLSVFKCGLLWTWSVMNCSVMNVVCYELVCYEQVCNGRGLFWVVCYERGLFWKGTGGNGIIHCHRQTNRNRHNWNIWHNTWSTLFIRITSVFSYLYCKQTNTLHLYSMHGGIKTSKHNLRTTFQLSYHGCKYLTHTSKTPHLKRTQMVVTV